MSNNLSPAAREFLRGCHKNDQKLLRPYIEGRAFNVDVVFRGMVEAIKYKSWDAFFVVYDFASVKFKTHPRRLQDMAEEVLWEISAVSTESVAEMSSVLNKIIGLCRSNKISSATYAAAQKNKNDIFEHLLPHFVPDRITYEILFHIGLQNQNDTIQNALFDHIDVSEVREILWASHQYQYNRDPNKTQSNIDRLEAMVSHRNLTQTLQTETSPDLHVFRKKI